MQNHFSLLDGGSTAKIIFPKFALVSLRFTARLIDSKLGAL